MPARSTSGTPRGTATKASPGTRGRKASNAGMFSPVVDAMMAAARQVSDAAALDAVDALDACPEAIEGIGRGFRQVGRTLADEIDWEPRLLDFFETLGDAIIAAADPARRGAAAVRRVEDERIRNAEEGGAKRERWDVARNRGAGGRRN